MEFVFPAVVLWAFCGVAGSAILSNYNKAGIGFLLGFALGPIGLLIAWTIRSTRKPKCCFNPQHSKPAQNPLQPVPRNANVRFAPS